MLFSLYFPQWITVSRPRPFLARSEKERGSYFENQQFPHHLHYIVTLWATEVLHLLNSLLLTGIFKAQCANSPPTMHSHILRHVPAHASLHCFAMLTHMPLPPPRRVVPWACKSSPNLVCTL